MGNSKSKTSFQTAKISESSDENRKVIENNWTSNGDHYRHDFQHPNKQAPSAGPEDYVKESESSVSGTNKNEGNHADMFTVQSTRHRTIGDGEKQSVSNWKNDTENCSIPDQLDSAPDTCNTKGVAKERYENDQLKQSTAKTNNSFDNPQAHYSEMEYKQNIKLQQMQIDEMINKATRVEMVFRQDDSTSVLPFEDMYKENLYPRVFKESMEYIEKCLEDMSREIQKLTIEKEHLMEEKNEYMDRLSKVAGARLTENNPNICDLNDQNRPMKLAEQLNKIYDDEWTDAMQELEKKSKKKKKQEKHVHHLFSVIKAIYKTCLRKADFHFYGLGGHLFAMNNPSNDQVDGMLSEFPEERKNIIDSRKKTSPGVSELLKKTIKEDAIYRQEIAECDPTLNGKTLKILEYSSYFEKCVEVCWQLVIQDPSVYMETEDLKGTKLNKDTHKEYTQSGKQIKYVVWPALYLRNENGEKASLLSKGVVQPEKHCPTENNGNDNTNTS